MVDAFVEMFEMEIVQKKGTRCRRLGEPFWENREKAGLSKKRGASRTRLYETGCMHLPCCDFDRHVKSDRMNIGD